MRGLVLAVEMESRLSHGCIGDHEGDTNALCSSDGLCALFPLCCSHPALSWFSDCSPAFLPHALSLQPACSLSLIFVKSHLSLIPSSALSEEFCSPYFTWELSHSFPES